MPTRFTVLATILAALLAGCAPKAPASADSDGPRSASGATEELAIPVAIEYVRTDSIASYYSATTTLEVERQAEVPARVKGVIQSIAVEEGDVVQTAAALIQIANDEYRLRLEQTTAAAKNLAAQVDRLERIQEDLVSAEEIQTAHKDLATARAEEGLAKLSLSYTMVKAPFAGRIVKRHVDVGQTVEVNAPLFVLADFDPLLARIHVPAKEFRNIESDQDVTLVLDSTGERLKGRITLVSPVIDPSTGTIKVTVEVPVYPRDTRPGDFAEILIVTERRDNSVIVSQGAVFTDKGEQVVFVAAGKRAERRVVDVGFSDDLHVEITNGLQTGEAVVVKGQRSLKHGSPLKVLEDGRADTTPSNLGDVEKKPTQGAKAAVKST